MFVYERDTALTELNVLECRSYPVHSKESRVTVMTVLPVKMHAHNCH